MEEKNLIFDSLEEGVKYFKDLGYKIKKGLNWFIVIPKEEEIEKENNKIEKYFVHKTCTICNSDYKPNNSRQNVCKCCKLFLKCAFCGKYFLKSNTGDKYLKKCILNNNRIEEYFHIKGCCSSFYLKKRWNNSEWAETVGLPANKENIKKAQARVEYLRENDPEWRERQNKISVQNLEYANTKNKELRETNPEYVEKMRQSSSKNIKKAQEKYLELLKDREWFENIFLKGLDKTHGHNRNLWKNDKEWSANMRKICAENGTQTIHFAQEKQIWLRENDPEWRERERQQSQKNIAIANKYLDEHPEIRRENAKIARELRLQQIKESLLSLSLSVSENSIDVSFENILKLSKNDICGAYAIKAKYKNDINTKKDGKVYNLLVCKSVKMYDEVYWALRVISQPEKQNKIISETNPWTSAKWWYIANLYYDFEFVLLTDQNSVSEEEALLVEAKYAVDNDMFIEFDENHVPQVEYEVRNGKHRYFSL